MWSAGMKQYLSVGLPLVGANTVPFPVPVATVVVVALIVGLR